MKSSTARTCKTVFTQICTKHNLLLAMYHTVLDMYTFTHTYSRQKPVASLFIDWLP